MQQCPTALRPELLMEKEVIQLLEKFCLYLFIQVKKDKETVFAVQMYLGSVTSDRPRSVLNLCSYVPRLLQPPVRVGEAPGGYSKYRKLQPD